MPKKKINRILIVNDDGIAADGLKVAERIAHVFSDDVWIVAPNRERSGSGCALSFQDPIRLEQLGEKRFAIDGTPVDCAMIALHHLMLDQPPDLILSGVNVGQNIAEDLIYSGTVSGAMQGLVSGIFAIALSQAFGLSGRDKINWETAEHFAPKVIDALLDGGFDQGAYNINFPDRAVDDVEGWALAHQGRRAFPLLQMLERKDPRNRRYYWVGFSRHLFTPEEGSDIHAIYGGKISITPLQLSWADHKKIDLMKAKLTQGALGDINNI